MFLDTFPRVWRDEMVFDRCIGVLPPEVGIARDTLPRTVLAMGPENIGYCLIPDHDLNTTWKVGIALELP